jgi:pimeloyl-ACP methyl ester carboxylesterase
VIAPVAPGLVESAPFPELEDYRPIRLAGLVIELADELGLDRFDYVGWSWGATIGVHLAASRSERLTALVLLDAGHTDVQDVEEWPDQTLEQRIADFEARAPAFSSWDELLGFARERATAWRPALEERIRAGMTERDGKIVARGSLAAAAAALHWTGVERPSEQLPRLGQHNVPILLVVATRNDTSLQVERFRAAVPHASIVEIDSEHDLLAHAHEETIRVVSDWLLERGQPRVA